MRMKTISEARTLRDAVKEFLSYKKARKVRERTLNDYKKYIDRFVEQSANSMDIDVLKTEILNYFAEIPSTSPARYNHPYQYLWDCLSCCYDESTTIELRNLDTLKKRLEKTTQTMVEVFKDLHDEDGVIIKLGQGSAVILHENME